VVGDNRVISKFGEAPMLELKERLTGVDPIQLFIDAAEVRGASLDVSCACVDRSDCF
jgi:hypothetical protein